MTSKLDQLRSMTTVVADTGDIEAVRRLKPVDCTTNPSIVLKALGTPEFEDTVNEADRLGCAAGRRGRGAGRRRRRPPGRVGRRRARRARPGPGLDRGRRRPLVRHRRLDHPRRGRSSRTMPTARSAASASSSSSPPPGKASAPPRSCRRSGIDCNLTLVFHRAQAIACADAGVFLISPFVGRISDWYVKATGRASRPTRTRASARSATSTTTTRRMASRTVVMGASFRSTGQIEALAGCDRLTISPSAAAGTRRQRRRGRAPALPRPLRAGGSRRAWTRSASAGR